MQIYDIILRCDGSNGMKFGARSDLILSADEMDYG